MRSSILCILSAVLVVGAVHASVGWGTSEPETWILRVTGAGSQDRVPFEGALVAVNTAETYRRISGRTPYEVQITATALHGLLRSKSDTERLKVEVLKVEGDTERQLSWVTGSVVVVEQDNDMGRSMVKGIPR